MRQLPRPWGLLGSLALACTLLALPVGAQTAAVEGEEPEARDEMPADDAAGGDEAHAAADDGSDEESYADEESDDEDYSDEESDDEDYSDEDDEDGGYYDDRLELLFAESSLYLSGAATAAFATQRSDMKSMAQEGAGSLDGAEGVSSDLEDLNWGMNVRLGYRISPHFAAEAELEWIRRFEIDTRVRFDDDSRKKTSTDIRFVTSTANGKYYVLTGRTQPYLVAGAGWGYSTANRVGQSTKDRDDGFVVRGGAGIDWYANRNVALTFETAYVLPTGSGIEDLDYVAVQLGFLLRFYADD